MPETNASCESDCFLEGELLYYAFDVSFREVRGCHILCKADVISLVASVGRCWWLQEEGRRRYVDAAWGLYNGPHIRSLNRRALLTKLWIMCSVPVSTSHKR